MSTDKAVRGIQSIEVLGSILFALEEIKIPASLRQISMVTGMPQAKLYPYLVSMQRSNMITRSDNGQYSIGPLIKELGYIALHRYKPSTEASYAIQELSKKTGHAVLLAVWGTLGPTVIQFHNARFELYTELRIGSILSLMHSSTGRTFSAYMPENIIEEMLQHESTRQKSIPATTTKDTFWQSIKLIQAQGYEYTVDNPLPGINALSAPVFGVNQSIELVVTVINKSSYLTDQDSTLSALLETTDLLSRNLGYSASLLTHGINK